METNGREDDVDDHLKALPSGIYYWEFPGWGTVEAFEDPNHKGIMSRDFFNRPISTKESVPEVTSKIGDEETGCCKFFRNREKEPKDRKLGQWLSTALSANDITSSALYTAGIVAFQAGIWSPICITLVVILLYFFRKIYVELVTALPLNGGTYTALLNTTPKLLAAIAACLSLLSYIATAVVSATSAMLYLQSVWKNLQVVPAAIIVLAIFCILCLIGMKESAIVALVICLFHMLVLGLIIVFGFIQSFRTNWDFLKYNGRLPINYVGIPGKIYFGFSTGLLGITGFETSANFVEQQRKGVFPKTLRNMWIAVTAINPLISLLAFSVLPYEEILLTSSALLSSMAERSAGLWLKYLLVADAVMVLSGAVLTAYVGMIGLVQRMSEDRCLPRFLLKENPCTHTHYITIIGFAALCASLVLLTWGQIEQLGNVYAVSFLSVMGLFCLGNIMLKIRRRSMRGKTRATWYIVVFCWAFVTAGLIGNVIISPIVLAYFALYYLPIVITVLFVFQRSLFLRFLLYITNRMKYGKWIQSPLMRHAQDLLKQLESEKLIFLTKTGDIRTINKAVLYVLSNEMSKWLKIVHVYENRNEAPANIVEDVKMLDLTYPEIRLDCVLFEGTFSPATLTSVSEKLGVPKNRMFITTPSPDFPYTISDLGSVRIITDRSSSGIQHALSAMDKCTHSAHVRNFLNRTLREGDAPRPSPFDEESSIESENNDSSPKHTDDEFIDPHVKRLMGSRSASVRELVQLAKQRSTMDGIDPPLGSNSSSHHRETHNEIRFGSMVAPKKEGIPHRSSQDEDVHDPS